MELVVYVSLVLLGLFGGLYIGKVQQFKEVTRRKKENHYQPKQNNNFGNVVGFPNNGQRKGGPQKQAK